MNYQTALVQLPLVRETARERVVSPADVRRVCDDIASLAQETFQILTLDARHRLLNRHMVSLGVVDSALIAPREVFRAAILDSSTALIVVHNHPSGDPTPSAEDVRITRQLVEAGRVMAITIMDHVVVGRPVQTVGGQPGQPGYVSLRESGLVDFSEKVPK
jgi:DNA repair protein RadC